MFNKFFFKKHQKKLLWLLNTPLIRIWFRKVMRIWGKSSSVGKHKIIGIRPNVICWEADGKRFYEFRCRNKFSHRLIYVFKPLWALCHCWDLLVNLLRLPKLNLGFDTFYPDPNPETTSVDGDVSQGYAQPAGVVWATIIAAAGSGAFDTGSNDRWAPSIGSCEGPPSGQWVTLGRAIYLFDTSALGAGFSIGSAVMSLYGLSKVDNLSITPDVDVYASTPASNTSLASGDYAQIGSVSQTGSPLTYANMSTSSYNDFTFNATGRENIAKTGVSKFGTRNANYDVAAVTPAWLSNTSSYFIFYFADQTGTANDPKLVVSAPVVPSFIPKIIFF